MKTQQAAQVRWMIRRDMDDVLAIESATFAEPGSEDDFLSVLRQRNSIGMVAERDGGIVGYMLYVLDRDSLELVNFAVPPSVRRCGVGRAMVNRLKTKLTQQRRQRSFVTVRDSNLGTQLFFRDCGFVAESVIR